MKRKISLSSEKSYIWSKTSTQSLESIFNSHYESLGTEQSKSDPSIFNVKRGGIIIIIIVHVDDILFTGNNNSQIMDFIRSLSAKLEIRIEPQDTKFVGFSIERNNQEGTTKLYNSLMITELLKTFGMENCNAVSTPIIVTINSDQAEITQKPYKELVGSLLYLSTTCRPEISFTFSYLTRFMDKATDEHWNMALRVVKYLNGTKEYG